MEPSSSPTAVLIKQHIYCLKTTREAHASLVVFRVEYYCKMRILKREISISRVSVPFFVLILGLAILFLFLTVILSNAQTEIPLGDTIEVEPPVNSVQPNVRFAVIGDFGKAGPTEADVAELVKSWEPDFIVTTGDNNYDRGSAATIDANIGQYYHNFIGAYGGEYGDGAAQNRFFPSLGNHDWRGMTCLFGSCRGAYLDYFTLPGNERYYDFVWGPVHIFILDSDSKEPDGNAPDSRQAQWLRTQLLNSRSPWKLVFLHHSPFSSSSAHGSNPKLQWPYKEWGSDVVLAGHDHTYEQLLIDDLPYFVNGLGGKSKYDFGLPLSGSQVRFNDDFGAMIVEVNRTQINIKFVTRDEKTIDVFTEEKDLEK